MIAKRGFSVGVVVRPRLLPVREGAVRRSLTEGRQRLVRQPASCIPRRRGRPPRSAATSNRVGGMHPCPQPQSAHRPLPWSVLASVDDCGSLTASPPSPLGTRFPPSPTPTLLKKSRQKTATRSLLSNPRAAQACLRQFWASALRSTSCCPHASVRYAHPSLIAHFFRRRAQSAGDYRYLAVSLYVGLRHVCPSVRNLSRRTGHCRALCLLRLTTAGRFALRASAHWAHTSLRRHRKKGRGI